MRTDYKSWLTASGYQDNTVSAQLHRVGKVEQYYGNLDEIIKNDGYAELIKSLTYSTADERAGKPNPSKIKFEGNIRNNLQSYKNAVVRYHEFARGEARIDDPVFTGPILDPTASETVEKQRLSLERDMQVALRANIALLEVGLVIIDDGIERSVTSGFIDILCRDSAGHLVVVELKAGRTDARVIGQILGYMGDLIEEEDNSRVRGIIVAHEFDQRTRSAAKAVSELTLFRYSVSFRFVPET